LKNKIICGSCSGNGYSIEFSEGNTIIVNDCPMCHGKGFDEYIIDDRRKISQKKKLFLPSHD
jgi:DnaJ-class molecular chaperone